MESPLASGDAPVFIPQAPVQRREVGLAVAHGFIAVEEDAAAVAHGLEDEGHRRTLPVATPTHWAHSAETTPSQPSRASFQQ